MPASQIRSSHTVRQTMIDQKVRREGALHGGRVLVSRSFADPARIGGALQPPAVAQDRLHARQHDAGE